MGRFVRKQKLSSPAVDAAKSGSKAGLGCLLLFALPFALFGAGMGIAVVRDLWLWQAAQRWVETPATLLEAKLESDSDGDGTTYRATARYAYEVNGQRYESNEVSIHGGGDNIGSLQRDRGQALEEALKAGGRTVCYVNPRDPRDALLFRDLRPGMVAFKLLFAAVFGGVGFGLLAAAYFGRGMEKRKERAEKSYPGKPWMWREDWAAGRVRSSEGALAWFVTFFAGVWNAVSWPVAWMAWYDGRAERTPQLLVAIFPLAGAGMALWCAYLWLRRLKWGVSEFEMAAVPGVIGGPLAGVIHAPGGIRPADGFRLRLVCNESRSESNGGDSSTSVEARWEREQTIHRELLSGSQGRTLIPVKFLVPFGQPPSGDSITWQLEVKAETLGIDYFAAFEVPVFKTAASSAAVTEESAVEAGEEPELADFRTTVARLNAVLEEELPDRRVIRFPMGRNVGMAGFTGLFTLIWIGIAAALFASDVPRVFPWGMAALGALFVYATINALFSSTRLAYSPRGIEYAHRLLGFGRTHDLPRSRVQSVSVDKSGTKVGDAAYRKVVATTSEGEVTLVKEIPRSADAEALAADMRRVLELDSGEMPLEAELPKDFLDAGEEPLMDADER
jgi:hypothetical protein